MEARLASWPRGGHAGEGGDGGVMSGAIAAFMKIYIRSVDILDNDVQFSGLEKHKISAFSGVEIDRGETS
jgi:hypothetical protein